MQLYWHPVEETAPPPQKVILAEKLQYNRYDDTLYTTQTPEYNLPLIDSNKMQWIHFISTNHNTEMFGLLVHTLSKQHCNSNHLQLSKTYTLATSKGIHSVHIGSDSVCQHQKNATSLLTEDDNKNLKEAHLIQFIDFLTKFSFLSEGDMR